MNQLCNYVLSGVPNSEHSCIWMGEDKEEQEELGGIVFIADVEGTSIPGEQEGKTNERVEETVLEVYKLALYTGPRVRIWRGFR